MNFREEKSLTLVEMLVAAFILLIGICGILGLFANTMTQAQSSWDITVATSHAESILEQMQSMKTVEEIEHTDWAKWAKDNGLNTLADEEVTALFTKPQVNLLDIQVTIQWQGKTRDQTVVFNTKLAK